MEKELNIIQMEKLYMKVIGLMINLKEMEKNFLKMMNTTQVNIKMV